MSFQFSPETFIVQFDSEISKRKSEIEMTQREITKLDTPEKRESINSQIAILSRRQQEITAIPESSYGSHPDPNIRAQQRANKGLDISNIGIQISNLGKSIANEAKPLTDRIAVLESEIKEFEEQKRPFVIESQVRSKTTGDGTSSGTTIEKHFIDRERAPDFNPYRQFEKSNSSWLIIVIIIVIAGLVLAKRGRK